MGGVCREMENKLWEIAKFGVLGYKMEKWTMVVEAKPPGKRRVHGGVEEMMFGVHSAKRKREK